MGARSPFLLLAHKAIVLHAVKADLAVAIVVEMVAAMAVVDTNSLSTDFK